MKPHLPTGSIGNRKSPEKNGQHPTLDLKRTGLAVATIVILSVLLSIHMLPSKVDLKLGEVARQDIIANRPQRYLDSVETELRKSQAAANVGKAYDVVPNASDQAVGALKTVFSVIESARTKMAPLPVFRKIASVRSELGTLLGTGMSDKTLTAMLSASPADLRDYEDNALRIVSAAMGNELREDPADMRKARKAAAEEAYRLLKNPEKARLVGEIAQDSLRPNRIYNEERTFALQDKARDNVAPVYRLILQGDVVIAKGDRVLQEHVEKFEALGLVNPVPDYRSIISLTIFAAIAVVLVVAFLARYHPDVYASTRALVLLAVIVIVSTLALRVGGSILGIKLLPWQVGYFGVLWIVTAGMFVAVLLNPHVSVLITALLSMVLSLMLNNELRYTASTFISSLVGIYSVANIRDRNDLIRSTGLLAGVGVLLVWVMGGINSDPVQQMLIGTVWAMGTAVVSVWLFFLVVTLLERPFGRTTHISLLELADTNKRLLRRLVMEAPGTYTHSMAVGHLAETAAESIGADSLVSRVASYYHDIGKIRRPHFFVENQHVNNVHDRMNPTLSALVITSHIKDGIEIAREHGLPKVVADVIVQHHGTSLVQYFYSQATGEQEACTALESQFRYSGPKPQTKEAAIVMLADSVEAASRCIVKPTPAKLELMVNRVVAEKLRDGQLDESDLTFREVSTISNSFVRALTGTLHARIDYPDPLGIENKRPANNADTDSKLTREAGEAEESSEPGPTAVAG